MTRRSKEKEAKDLGERSTKRNITKFLLQENLETHFLAGKSCGSIFE